MVTNMNIKGNHMDFKHMNSEEKIIWRTGQYKVPYTLSKEQAFERLKKKIADGNDRENRQVYRLSLKSFLAAAAVILVLILGFWVIWSSNKKENIVAGKGHHTDYRLPDGSMVMLNADTKISYNKSSFDRKRLVRMDGEAFFNIEKGTAFTIKTTLADIKIMGTSFNVFARGNSFKVSCFTGKILVVSGEQSVTVAPVETAIIEDNKLKLFHDENIQASAAWRTGEFNYENTSLNLVFDEIERQFNVTFVLPLLDNKYFTGSITNKNLVEALDIVCLPMGLTYEIGSNSKIIIKFKTD
jgi:ferric-dicitrate binding protein FerR (iron transport regulator)